MNIAIFAPSISLRERLARAVTHPDDGVTSYADMESLCHAVQAGRADAVLIALVPEADAGLALARRLRRISLDCEIVFAADTAALAAEAMEFRASGYLLLPLDGAQWANLAGEIRARRIRRPRKYAVHTRTADRLVPHGKIRYFRSDGHYAHVYIEGEAEPLTHLKRLDDIENETAGLPYLRCHQSYLVRCEAIDRADSRYVWLKDGTQLPVSRRYARAVAAFVRGEKTGGSDVEN